MQYVSRQTPNHGHTLDLVLTLGLNLHALCIDDFFVSDHKCIIFDTIFNADTQSIKRMTHSPTLNNLSADNFASIFADLSKDMAFPAQTNDLVRSFNNLCLSTQNIFSPFFKNKYIHTILG